MACRCTKLQINYFPVKFHLFHVWKSDNFRNVQRGKLNRRQYFEFYISNSVYTLPMYILHPKIKIKFSLLRCYGHPHGLCLERQRPRKSLNSNSFYFVPGHYTKKKNLTLKEYFIVVPVANASWCTAAEGLLYKPWSLVVPTCTARCLHQRPQ